ncbi:hypothetical protein BC938DRAFT_476348 [Jimgerdemannia flammicorona]|uniref:Glycoside hydrolase family 3 C-terminal domain-containing protein n=1 Tax=Jimgerdemannia flammicorona TaxID=994334 RepID=A0A433QQL5_9FUNG|nr:hypothetical protein BC938DRAFT_476348 [Jimgerdemannia flammicorona]
MKKSHGNIHITLAQGQIDLVTKVAVINKKVVLVLTEDRPRVIQNAADVSGPCSRPSSPPVGWPRHWRGALGITNPSGRLRHTYPRYLGNQGLVYWRQVNDNNWQSLYEFGHGLSYWTFAYSNITVSSTTLTPKHPVKASVRSLSMLLSRICAP